MKETKKVLTNDHTYFSEVEVLSWKPEHLAAVLSVGSRILNTQWADRLKQQYKCHFRQ